jgi:hypothetical protein
MMEKSFAAIILIMCLAMLVRMMLRPRLRARVDRAVQRRWWWCRDALTRLRRRRISNADAQRQAREAIARRAARRICTER